MKLIHLYFLIDKYCIFLNARIQDYWSEDFDDMKNCEKVEIMDDLLTHKSDTNCARTNKGETF